MWQLQTGLRDGHGLAGKVLAELYRTAFATGALGHNPATTRGAVPRVPQLDLGAPLAVHEIRTNGRAFTWGNGISCMEEMDAGKDEKGNAEEDEDGSIGVVVHTAQHTTVARQRQCGTDVTLEQAESLEKALRQSGLCLAPSNSMMTTFAAITLALTIQATCDPWQPQPELFEVTAYSPTCDADSPFHDGLTAMLIPADPSLGIAAVDPRVIPMFSRIWIEGLGWYLAADTGGLVKGRRIDVLMPTRREALQYGRRKGQLVLVFEPEGSWHENRQVYNALAQLQRSTGPKKLENVEFTWSQAGTKIALR